MRHVLVPILVGILLLGSIGAWGKQGTATPPSVESQRRADLGDARAAMRDCGISSDAFQAAKQVVDRDRRALSAPIGSGSSTAAATQESPQSNLERDLLILDRAERELDGCKASNNLPGPAPDSMNTCAGEQILNFQMNHPGEQEREIPIYRLPGSPVFFYESGMTIDADGAPNAYHPDNTGLDDLANAGSPGNWQGLARNSDGEPFVQGPDDPFPGYYVSATALTDRTKPMNDPAHYVDSTKIPYIVMPGIMARQFGALPGDFAVVVNVRNGARSFAIFGDVGPVDRIGEGSIALAENLGIRSNARNGGTPRGILYIVFPGSGDGKPRQVEEINSETEKLLQGWGGTSQVMACVAQQFYGSARSNGSAN